MGILSKVFGKKSLDSLKKVEEELLKLQKRIQCEIVALVGTGGRLKGLPLIYALSSEKEEINLKKYSARLIELNNPLNNLVEKKKIEKTIIFFDDKMFYFKQVAENVCFFSLTKENILTHALQQWIDKNTPVLEKLFTKEEE